MNFMQMLKGTRVPQFWGILKRFNPNQPRDRFGRWDETGASVPDAAKKLAQEYADQYANQKDAEERKRKLVELTDKVLGQLSADDRAEFNGTMRKVADQINAGDTKRKYYTKGKGYTKARRKLHKEVMEAEVQEMLKRQAGEGEQATVIFLGGRGGSGKSSFDKAKNPEGVYDREKFYVMDPDEIKAKIGEAEARRTGQPWNSENAALYHEEASDVSERLVTWARKNKINIVLDMTLKSDKSGVASRFLGEGYRMEAHYMFLPPLMAATRAIASRWKGRGPGNRGRLVPPNVILGNVNNEANFDKIARRAEVWSVWRNDGSAPVKAFSSR